MRSVIGICLLVLVLILNVVGCANIAPPMPTIGVGYSEGEVRELAEAIVLVLHQHDFVITLANSEIGLITTDWHIMSTELYETIALIVSKSLTGSYDPMKMRMQLSIMVDRHNKRVKIKPSKQTHDTLRGWSYSELYELDKQILSVIAEDIAEKIGSSANDITWQGPIPSPVAQQPPVVSDNELKLFGAAVLATVVVVYYVFIKEE